MPLSALGPADERSEQPAGVSLDLLAPPLAVPPGPALYTNEVIAAIRRLGGRL